MKAPLLIRGDVSSRGVNTARDRSGDTEINHSRRTTRYAVSRIYTIYVGTVRVQEATARRDRVILQQTSS